MLTDQLGHALSYALLAGSESSCRYEGAGSVHRPNDDKRVRPRPSGLGARAEPGSCLFAWKAAPPARYCVGDVGGERGDRPQASRRPQRIHAREDLQRSLVALWDEEAEFYPLRAQLEGESYLGHDGLMRFVAELTEDFEEVRFEIEETRDAGEQVVGIGRFRARGRASGVDLNVPFGAVQRVRRGKIVYTRLFSEPAEALEAAGLSE